MNPCTFARPALLLVSLFVPLIAFPSLAGAAPCENLRELGAAIECVKANEPAYLSAATGAEEAKELRTSAYRLINPQLELEYGDGKNSGNISRQKIATLLFTLERGGKRDARAMVLEAEGYDLRADAFEQQISSLTEIGGAILRLKQLETVQTDLEESVGAFRRVIRLYRSRGSLSPEQRVSLSAFELVLLNYEGKLIDVAATLMRYRRRIEPLFGANTPGAPLDFARWPIDLPSLRADFTNWLENTPEMLRVRADAIRAEGETRVAAANLWPNMIIGPSFGQNNDGPTTYTTFGFRAAFPLPILDWNPHERKSKALTETRVKSRLAWTRQDVRTKYESVLTQLERITQLLKGAPAPSEIHRKHSETENLYERGMISGALMIETHRALIEHLEARHELENEYLTNVLTLSHLKGSR